MKNRLTLGIDTSCYTTSIALVDSHGRIILDKRKILMVKKGYRGLRQSEAVFQHMLNLPELFKSISPYAFYGDIETVSVSSKPRNIEGSYMPVFKVSTSYGKSIASVLNARYIEFSHQEGHIEAAKGSLDYDISSPFIVVHISGGTTEILKVIQREKGYEITIIGGTKDISAGQLIDRIGVMMDLNFPCGEELDKISKDGQPGKIKLPVSVREGYINFSGTETKLKKYVQEGKSKEDIAIALFDVISQSLVKGIIDCCKNQNIWNVLLVGGVASNSYIRHHLVNRLLDEDIKLHICDSKYCTDNAVGTALLGINFNF